MRYSEMKQFKERISKTLIKVRMLRRLTVDEVAASTGVNRRTIYEFENPNLVRQHSVFKIYPLVSFYKIKFDDLFN